MSITQWIRFGLAVFVLGTGMARADGVLTPAHGGRMAENQGHRLELAVTGKTVDLYLTDHQNQGVASEGASARVLFLVGGKKVETMLKPMGDNRLSGESPEVTEGFSSAVVTLEKDGKNVSARISASH